MSELNESVPAGYQESDVRRFAIEPTKREGRSPFARDRARVLHSAGLRRLAAKTQVMVAGESDFPRTRLTHTLEVAQIARELGGGLGADPDLTDLAGLAHDLGHPPFGHNGEAALIGLAERIGGFEGNAQSFRLLTRLEAKVSQPPQRPAGLNLTRAALDATIKYPWDRDTNHLKFNYYEDDGEVFAWVRDDAPVRRRCFEAQVMDWSDDVAYSVHDVEDGIHSGHIDVDSIRSAFEREQIALLAQRWYADWAETGELEAALSRLAKSNIWPTVFDGTQTCLAALKNFTSQITGRFVTSAMRDTQAGFGSRRLTRYAADLLVSREAKCEVASLKAVANLYVFQRPDAEPEYARQRQIIRDLVGALADGQTQLDPAFREFFEIAETDTARFRVIIDQVASLTDSSVMRWYRRLS